MTAPDVVVVIPAYEPSDQLPRLVDDLASAGLTSVLVVDDGSGPGYDPVFAAVSERPGVRVLRHGTNRGKGVALRTALSSILDDHPGVVGVVTADADGQHLPADIRRVADELVERAGRAARVCVLGQRDFDLPDIPLRSRLGNKVTTGVIRALFGRRLPDTQTGLRGMSTDLLPELLDVPGDRFDHEMRALMHLLGSRARISAVPIETVYEDGANATSHFRPLRDSAIIYAAVLRQIGLFVLSSGSGFLVDIGVFVVVMDTVFDGNPTLRAVGVATLVARVVSALTNYAVNHLVVFASRERVHRALGRYAVLAAGILGASWLLTSGLSHLLGQHVVWAKIVVDSGLFAVSFLAQKHWVFASRVPHPDEVTEPATLRP